MHFTVFSFVTCHSKQTCCLYGPLKESKDVHVCMLFQIDLGKIKCFSLQLILVFKC